jgi:hypothetical protein
MNILLFIFATIGLTNILVHGKILDLIKIRRKTIREWMHFWDWSKQLFECYECTGFWGGLIAGILVISRDPFIFISCGFAGSVLSQFYSEIVYLIRSKTDFVVEDNDESSAT